MSEKPPSRQPSAISRQSGTDSRQPGTRAAGDADSRPNGNEPLDPKLKAWLTDEIGRRVLPALWVQSLLNLVSWASTRGDGKALHGLLMHYPRQEKKP